MNNNQHRNYRTGEFARPKKVINGWYVLGLTVVFVGAVYLLDARTPTKAQPKTQPLSVEQIQQIQNDSIYAEYRNRQDIKQKQEAIVREAYLLDKKAKLQAELTEVEKGLEEIRTQKLSF